MEWTFSVYRQRLVLVWFQLGQRFGLVLTVSQCTCLFTLLHHIPLSGPIKSILSQAYWPFQAAHLQPSWICLSVIICLLFPMDGGGGPFLLSSFSFSPFSAFQIKIIWMLCAFSGCAAWMGNSFLQDFSQDLLALSVFLGECSLHLNDWFCLILIVKSSGMFAWKVLPKHNLWYIFFA